MSFKPSELPLLVSLDVLLEERNVTRAAARLHVSQPALSGQLARLRRLFKDPLLVPSETGRGMVATPKAEEIAESLRDALSRLDAISYADAAFDPGVDAATFRIRGSCCAIDVFTPALFGVIERHGNTALRAAFQADDENEPMLAPFENGEVDLALVSATRVPPSLKVRELSSEPLVLAHRPGHPCTDTCMDIDAYCALRHAVVSSSGRLCDDMDHHLQARGLTRGVMVSAANSHALRGILIGTDLVCTLPRSMAASLGSGIEWRALPFDAPSATLTMAWHARMDKQPSHRWLREQITRMAGPLPLRPAVAHFTPDMLHA
ncbi:LysR family transcriptional regulator [Luteibacter aegosomatis]|uniref:LysR family transcriptional regulator n=1 Tax=Luteibacter aegosomatis TaxID=2911537 RepID=UPI001FF999CD|nr:LysR family transcriptional regulator [Luteibacter aegosomatis]UPG84765.1 LysR family transcriptional regulator [Luteibacter aegosomatis]